jgi:hypothetical protein
MMRSYVDGYPPGATVPLAINPADPSDVRYEVGLTLTNAIVPGALGFMGVLFATIGWATRRSRHAEADATPASPQTVGWIGTLFAGIGLLLGAIGGWLLTQDTPLDWPPVEAEAVSAGILPVRSSSSRNSPSSRTSYDVQVTFVYRVADVSYRSMTTSGSASATQIEAERRRAGYAPGTRHTIRYRPDDPNVIRFEVSRVDVYALPVALLAMGTVFLLIGIVVSRKLSVRT